MDEQVEALDRMVDWALVPDHINEHGQFLARAATAGKDLADAVEAFIAATVPSVSDEWTELGEALGRYKQESSR